MLASVGSVEGSDEGSDEGSVVKIEGYKEGNMLDGMLVGDMLG